VSVVGVTRRTAPAAKDFDFALRLGSNVAQVRERGIYRGEIDFADGDVFRIQLLNGKVTYAKNGVIFRTTNSKSVTPSRVGALLYVTNSWVETPVIP
jgi:hypothetical protein